MNTYCVDVDVQDIQEQRLRFYINAPTEEVARLIVETWTVGNFRYLDRREFTVIEHRLPRSVVTVIDILKTS